MQMLTSVDLPEIGELRARNEFFWLDLDDPDADTVALVGEMLGLHKLAIVVQRQVFDRASERIGALPGFDRHLESYYRDVGDHLLQAIDDVESARDALQGMLDTHTNEVQERLTLVATIFLPLTLITSFFGQNFNWLVDHLGPEWTFWR